MKIYWIQDDIPALRGLSDAEKKAAKKSVFPKVYKHWQVWLPLTVLAIALFCCVFLMPMFPGRTPALMLGALIFGKITQLPINSYLQHYLEE